MEESPWRVALHGGLTRVRRGVYYRPKKTLFGVSTPAPDAPEFEDAVRAAEEDWRLHYVRGAFHCNLRYPPPGHAVGRTSANTDWLLVESGFRGGVQPRELRQRTCALFQGRGDV